MGMQLSIAVLPGLARHIFCRCSQAFRFVLILSPFLLSPPGLRASKLSTTKKTMELEVN
jgi:hypothetical protein